MLRYTYFGTQQIQFGFGYGKNKALLPVSPPYFEKDALTDKSERFFVSETIREKILKYYKRKFHILLKLK